jgi:hypothetical protein
LQQNIIPLLGRCVVQVSSDLSHRVDATLTSFPTINRAGAADGADAPLYELLDREIRFTQSDQRDAIMEQVALLKSLHSFIQVRFPYQKRRGAARPSYLDADFASPRSI